MIRHYRFFILFVVAALIRVGYGCLINTCAYTGEVHNPLVQAFGPFRAGAVQNIRALLPSPHSELLLGMLLGVDDLKNVPTFNDILKQTGTIHVVVVSGYNISLVFEFIILFFGNKFRIRNLIAALTGTFIYAAIAGLQPPVIRAWIMGSIASVGKYTGRSLDALLLLIFSGACMIMINPAYMFSLSFQLSFLATLSLVVYAPFTEKLVKKRNLFFSDLSTTLAAQVLVWPLIAYKFDRLSFISPFVNALILWTVPLATVLGGVTLVLSYFSDTAAYLSHLVYIPLDYFISTTSLLAKLPFASAELQVPVWILISYYAGALLVALKFNKSHAVKI